MKFPPPTTTASCTPILATSASSRAIPSSSAGSMPNPPSGQNPSPLILNNTRLYTGGDGRGRGNGWGHIGRHVYRPPGPGCQPDQRAAVDAVAPPVDHGRNTRDDDADARPRRSPDRSRGRPAVTGRVRNTLETGYVPGPSTRPRPTAARTTPRRSAPRPTPVLRTAPQPRRPRSDKDSTPVRPVRIERFRRPEIGRPRSDAWNAVRPRVPYRSAREPPCDRGIGGSAPLHA